MRRTWNGTWVLVRITSRSSLVPPADGDVRFDGRLLHLMHVVGVLKDVVGFGKPLLHVAHFGLDVVDDVAAGVVDVFRCRPRRG